MKLFNNQRGFAVIFILPIILVIVVGILFLLIKSTSFNNKTFIQKTTSIDSVAQKTLTTLNTTGVSFIRDGDIWLADIDGTNERQITKEKDIKEYYWIPETNRVVYSRIVENKEQVIAEIKAHDVIMDASETIHKRITKLGGVGEIAPHFWFDFMLSPKGTMVAYSGDFLEDNSNASLIIYNLNSKTKREIDESGIQSVFSPDEEKLAKLYKGNIYVYFLHDLSSNKLTLFPDPEEAYKTDPSKYSHLETAYNILDWAKDGVGIFYYFGNYGKGSTLPEATQHIYLLNTTSSKAKKITTSGPGEIDWYLDQTGDGEEIYYLVFDGKLYRYFLRKNNLKSGHTKQFNLSQGLSLSSSEFNLDVAENGDKVIYEYPRFIPLEDKPFSPTKTAYEVWLMNSDGTGNKKIFDNASNPKWKY